MRRCVKDLIVCFRPVPIVRVGYLLNYVRERDRVFTQEVPKEMGREEGHFLHLNVRLFGLVTVSRSHPQGDLTRVGRRLVQVLRTGQVTVRAIISARLVFGGEGLHVALRVPLVSSRLIPRLVSQVSRAVDRVEICLF